MVNPELGSFQTRVQPILKEFCFDCHGDGEKKGQVAFDEFKSVQDWFEKKDLWLAALKNVRAGMMPPLKKPQPSEEQKKILADWIKGEAFAIDPANPDPGRVTVRRLNRVEYRNTVRDLMGVDFDTNEEFPADDSGHGFDNIADVLTLPPMLLEKYLEAARTIVAKSVPLVAGVPVERVLKGRSVGSTNDNPLVLSYYAATNVTSAFELEQPGHYQAVLDLTSNEKFVDDVFDYNKCRFIFKIDGKELLSKEFMREGGRRFHFEYEQDWKPASHSITFQVEPLTPDQKQPRALSLKIDSVTLKGPMDPKLYVPPANYEKFFGKAVSKKASERKARAREILGAFASKAFRVPTDEKTAVRLASLAEEVYRRPGQTFEAGVAHAMVAVLASPRFIFREENVETSPPGALYPLVDEHALASRLSYFLWSTMPDDELRRLADTGKLRENLDAQVKRMMTDWRSDALIKNFSGQWLQTRDIDSVQIDSRAVLAREQKADPAMDKMRARFRELRQRPPESLNDAEKEEFAKVRAEFLKSFRGLRAELNYDLRQAMRRETEKFFDHIVRKDRPLVELIDCDYTFLNERLAKHYGMSNVLGDEMRLVQLPPDSQRGGILSQGTVLAVTSNPTRTSPVKRGVFILDNILGMPSPPPPPDIPPLEESAKSAKGGELTLRETLEIHRGKPLCSSCHNRMDPLGLAMENFNAMGMWRESERDHPVEVSGQLSSGEKFTNLRELKHILATHHRLDFHRCLTEKLLTYALGRGLEYYDVAALDSIVERVEREDGKFSALLSGIIESAPFQRRRNDADITVIKPVQKVSQSVAIKQSHE